MKVKELKLYNKYKHINIQEYIYIGIGNNGFYWFLYENNNYKISFSLLKCYGFDPDKITKDLNLETYVNEYGEYIKEYSFIYYSKQQIEKYFKPILKDKLYNILNR
jgi:hypothetical protein